MKQTKRILSIIIIMGILMSSLVFFGSAVTLLWPVPGHTNLSQGFHDGAAIDISDGSIAGATVVAAIGGTVKYKFTCGQQHYGSMGDCQGFGTGVVIYGDDGRWYQYAHMQANSIPSNVYVNAYVSVGQMIGRVGTTGNSSGNHLHFGISTGSYWSKSGINPQNESYTYSLNVWLDLNGSLDGQYTGSIAPHGTVDIYINGVRVADDVADFYSGNGTFPKGSTYEIKDIKAANGFVFNGVKEGSLKGTLNSDTTIALNFTTDLGSDFYARIAKKNSSKNLEASSEVTQEQQREGLNNLQLAKNGNDTTDPRQIWRLTRQSDGTYKIQNMYDNSVLDVFGAYTDIATNVITTREDHGRLNQRWYFNSLSGGYRVIPAHATSLSLDVYGDRDDSGSNVVIHSPNTSNAQIFSISKITYSKPAKPAASTVSVSKLGVPNSTTTLSWTASALKDSSFDHRSYTLYLTKDGSSYQTKTGLTSTSINLTLPKGTYTAKIRAINTKYFDYYTDGNTLTFTVKDCTTHTWNSGTVTKAATCTEAGVRTYTCTVNGCGASKTESIPALNHTTPNDDGNCTRCGTHLVDVEQHENPTNPTEPPAQQQTGACRWCGKTHGGIFGIFIGFFHTILTMLFGAKY